MDEVPPERFWQNPAAFDEAVLATHRIDHYCSSTPWILPAQMAFHPDHSPLVLRSSAGFAAVCRGHAPTIGRYYSAFESMWGLACPVVGHDARGLALDFFRAMHARRDRWDALWLGGLHRDSPLFMSLASVLSTTCSVRVGPQTNRYAADLEGGYDAWLGRRSPRFRANLRRDLRRAEREGITFDEVHDASDAVATYERIQRIERRSWKGMADSGISGGAMYLFYDKAVEMLISRKALRIVFARRDNTDVAYVFGGILGDTYRGLQCSFDESLRELALGNVVQARMIANLATEGIRWYDLGSEIDYKSRWSEPGISTVTLVALRR